MAELQRISDNDLLAKAQSMQSDGNLLDALRIYKDLLTRHDGNARLLHLAGTTALQAGQNELAETWLSKSCDIDPTQADTQCHLGVVHWNLGRFEAAANAYKTALKLNPAYPEALNNLCMVTQDGFKSPESALTLVDRAIKLRPDYADAYNNRGNVLQALDRYDEALASYDKSIDLKPDSASAHNNRGNALRKLGRLTDALSAYQEAIHLRPDYAEAFCNMGCTLADLGQVDDARVFYRRTLTLDPLFAKAHFNMAALADRAGNRVLALACLDRSIALDPAFPDAYWNKSLLKLLLGDFKEGFELYEWGWKNKIRGAGRGFKQPLWLGKESISGKRLLIHQEQGIGDCIHYARYVEAAVAMGATVIVETVAPLIPLLKSLKAPCQLVAVGEPLPDFDCYVPLMSLPLAFGTTLETLPPAKPYLFSETARVGKWSRRLGSRSRPRVGLAWSGSTLHKNDHNRSMALKELLPLLSLPLEFHCLQKEVRDEDTTCLPALPMIHTHDAFIGDFADTAALVELMDLVITVDTSVAHVAGAMGKPVWIMLPVAPDWRWLLDREDSLWYPNVRLFRQDQPGDWDAVIRNVRTAVMDRLCREEKTL